MSEIQNDKKTLDEGRSETLKDADAPLREQISRKLFNTLKDLNIAQKVVTSWETGISERSLWSERQQAWLSTWDEHLLGDTSGEFDGSSNLHIPMPFTVCKTLHARFIQAIWQDPPFNVKAQNEASLDSVSLVRDVLRYYLMRGANYNKGVGKVVDAWIWDWITQGSGLLKERWSVQYSRFMDVEEYMKPGAPQVVVDETGKQVLVPTQVPAEREVMRTKKCFDGPVFDLIDLEDLLIVGGNGDPDVADQVIHREYLTASELWTLVDRKIFDKEAVEAIIQAGPDNKAGAAGNEIKQDRVSNAGKTQLDTNQDLDRYEILEAYIKVDVDGSGINSDVVVWVHKQTRELARATYLYRISPKGERPFAKIDFQTRKGQEYGVGMPELLYPLSKEMDAVHNMRIDFGLVSVMPFGFYRPTSGIDPATIKLEPGVLIPVDNPSTDVFFPNLGNRTVFGFQEEAAIQNMVERMTSISDLNLGVMNGQGATRTATGARALVGEMSSNLDVYLRRLNWGWEKALRYLLDLLQTRMPEGLAFRLTGDGGADVFRKLNSAKDIYGDFDIEVSPNSASSNSSIQEENANAVLQMTLNPLLIQSGVVTVPNIYNATENYYRAKGIKDFSKYITKPQGALRLMSPEEEANQILHGKEVPVTPEMDHEGFLEFFQHFIDTDELMGQFQIEQIGLLKIQAKKHEQMLAAMQAQQSQTANLNQMRMNAQAGNQASGGVSIGGGQPQDGQSA